MAIPYTPYQGPRFSDLLGVVQNNLDAQLAREKMAMDEARANRLAAQEQANRERQHQQQMAQFALSEMKFNYEMGQDAPGGLNYMETMSSIAARDAAAKSANASAALTQERMTNPDRFWKPGAASRPRPLTAAQQKANADAIAMGQPPLYDATIAGPAANDPSVDLPSSAGAADPYLVGPPPVDGENTSGTGDSLLFPGQLMPPPVAPDDNTPPAGAPPVYSNAPPAPANGQGPLPMDAASVARRAAMEDARIKREGELSKSLNERRDAAKARLAVDPQDAIAATELQQVEKELGRLLAAAPKAQPADAEPPVMLDPRFNGAGKTTYINGMQMSDKPFPPAAEAPPERPGIGLLAKPENKTQAEANQFWDDGKNQARNLAGLENATDEELKAIASGRGPVSDDTYFPEEGTPYAKVLADKISDRFRMPYGADKPAIKGRGGDITAVDFIKAAAADELRRRNQGKGPAATSSLSPEKKKAAEAFPIQ